MFPDQAIGDEQQIAFARRFGELEIHPAKDHRSSRHPEIFRVSNVDEGGRIVEPRQRSLELHQRHLAVATPTARSGRPRARARSSHGIEVTPEGGETLFCNLYAVYEALPEAMRRRESAPCTRSTSHDTVLEKHRKLTDPGRFDKYDTRHPLVCRHPVTQRPFLFLSPHTMAGIEGMSPADSAALLEELVGFAAQDRFVYRHHLAQGRCDHVGQPLHHARGDRLRQRPVSPCHASHDVGRKTRYSPPDPGWISRRVPSGADHAP